MQPEDMIKKISEIINYLKLKGLGNKKIDLEVLVAIIEYFGKYDDSNIDKISEYLSTLTDKLDKISKEKSADKDRVLIAITKNNIEVYEIA